VLSDTAANILALTPGQIAALRSEGVEAFAVTDSAANILGLTADQIATLQSYGVGQDIEGGYLTSSTFTVSDTAANIEALSPSQITTLLNDGNGVRAIAVTDASLVLNAAQAAALSGSYSFFYFQHAITVPYGDTVTVADTAANIESLSPGQLGALGSLGLGIAATDTSVVLSAAQAVTLESAGLKLTVPTGHTVTLSDTAAQIEALTSGQIANLSNVVGITGIVATDSSVVLSMAQALALESAGLKLTVPAGDTVTLSDPAGLIGTLAPSQLSGFAAAGGTGIAATDASLVLNAAQAQAVTQAHLAVTVPAGDTVNVADTAANILILSASDIAALKAAGFAALTVVDTASDILGLSANQVAALKTDGLSAVAVSDSAANILALTADQLAALQADGVTAIKVSDSAADLLALSPTQIAALTKITGQIFSLSDTAAAIEHLSASDLAALKAAGYVWVASDRPVVLSASEAEAIYKAGLVVTVPAGNTVTVADTAAAILAEPAADIMAMHGLGYLITVVDTASGISSLSTADLAALASDGVTALAATDASVSLNVAQALALETANLQVAVPAGDGVTLSDTAAHIEALTSGQILAFLAAGVTAITATDASVALSTEQALALEASVFKVTAPAGDTVVLSDTAAQIDALTASQILALPAAGISGIVATDASVLLTAAQALALESAGLKVSVPTGDTVTLSDTAANIEALTALQLAGLPATGVSLVIATDVAPKFSPAVVTAIDGASGSTGDLNAGHTVTFSLTVQPFETMFVSGTPELLLNNGGIALYDAAHSTSTVLVFNYPKSMSSPISGGHLQP
jgi:hypothetical protein